MSQELATRSEQPRIVTILASQKTRDEMALVIPPGVDIDTLMARAKTAVISNLDLLRCTPQSILLAVKKSIGCGLELNGRDAHLVPYGTTAQFIIDYKGYVALGLRCGLRAITPRIVYENDPVFRMWTDDKGVHLEHHIATCGLRGGVMGAYVQTISAHGVPDYEWMTTEEIKAIQSRARGTPWKTDWNEMAKKTVIRRMSKRWDIDTRFKRAMEDDDDRFFEPVPTKAKLVLPSDGPELAPVAALEAIKEPAMEVLADEDLAWDAQ